MSESTVVKVQRSGTTAKLIQSMSKLKDLNATIRSWFIDIWMPQEDAARASYKVKVAGCKDLLQALRLKDPYCRDFYDCFCAIDTDTSDTVEYEEFVDFFNLPATKFLERF